jgi:tetratricopeptide (TPR) repeat protein
VSYFEEGNLSFDAQKYRLAISAYKKAIAAKEQHEAYSLYNLAVCYIQLKQYNKAIPILKSAISKRTESKFYFNLAYSYLKLNDTKKALIYFNTAWALNPEDKECEKAINIILKDLS